MCSSGSPRLPSPLTPLTGFRLPKITLKFNNLLHGHTELTLKADIPWLQCVTGNRHRFKSAKRLHGAESRESSSCGASVVLSLQSHRQHYFPDTGVGHSARVWQQGSSPEPWHPELLLGPVTAGRLHDRPQAPAPPEVELMPCSPRTPPQVIVGVDHLAWPKAAGKQRYSSQAGHSNHPGAQDRGQPSPEVRVVFSAKVIKSGLEGLPWWCSG